MCKQMDSAAPDPSVPPRNETTFDLTSLKFYELLLVVAAIVLARCRIWYNANLLFVMENIFVIVPFNSESASVKLPVFINRVVPTHLFAFSEEWTCPTGSSHSFHEAR